jgi:hypothetical protein
MRCFWHWFSYASSVPRCSEQEKLAHGCFHQEGEMVSHKWPQDDLVLCSNDHSASDQRLISWQVTFFKAMVSFLRQQNIAEGHFCTQEEPAQLQ